MRPPFLVAVALLAGSIASCSGGASPTDGPPASPSTAITTPEEAAARVAAVVPELAEIGTQDPDVIGGCCFWQATETDTGFQVLFEVGWGDCPAGCIDRHRWLYAVGRDGSVELIEESGPPVPSGVPGAGIGGAGGGILPGESGITGTVTAGPTCPVVPANDPNCADRPVEGVTILVLDAGGREVARVATDAAGRFAVTLPAGPYMIEPQPAKGYLRTPEPVAVNVGDGYVSVALAYDTGIR